MNTEHIKEISSQRIIRVVFLFPKHDATWYGTNCHEEHTGHDVYQDTNPDHVTLPPGADGFYFKEIIVMNVVDYKDHTHNLEFDTCHFNEPRFAGPFFPGLRRLTVEETLREFGPNAKTGNGMTISNEISYWRGRANTITNFCVYRSGIILPSIAP